MTHHGFGNTNTFIWCATELGDDGQVKRRQQVVPKSHGQNKKKLYSADILINFTLVIKSEVKVTFDNNKRFFKILTSQKSVY